ncbi:hypothetical protein JB92DRAFT_2824497 [Gautieria morchelliformis]|nr:hypothetical protein JB92DRAFT_2824497 [Gautieria morchelliformis]
MTLGAILPSALFRSRTARRATLNSIGTPDLINYLHGQCGVQCRDVLSGASYRLVYVCRTECCYPFIDHFSRKTLTTICYKYSLVAWLTVATIGFGLLTLLDITSSVAEREIYPTNAGIGIGMLFHAPFAAHTNGMSSQHLLRTKRAFYRAYMPADKSPLCGVVGDIVFSTRAPLFPTSTSHAVEASQCWLAALLGLHSNHTFGSFYWPPASLVLIFQARLPPRSDQPESLPNPSLCHVIAKPPSRPSSPKRVEMRSPSRWPDTGEQEEQYDDHDKDNGEPDLPRAGGKRHCFSDEGGMPTLEKLHPDVRQVIRQRGLENFSQTSLSLATLEEKR